MDGRTEKYIMIVSERWRDGEMERERETARVCVCVHECVCVRERMFVCVRSRSMRSDGSTGWYGEKNFETRASNYTIHKKVQGCSAIHH